MKLGTMSACNKGPCWALAFRGHRNGQSYGTKEGFWASWGIPFQPLEFGVLQTQAQLNRLRVTANTDRATARRHLSAMSRLMPRRFRDIEELVR